jgi:transposase, IS5 family
MLTAYSLHAPEVECIGKGKARPYEFGVKVSIATTVKHSAGGQFVTHAAALPGNPYAGHTRWARSFRRCKRSSATSSIAVSPMPATVATTPLPITVQGLHERPETPTSRRSAAIEPVIGHLKQHHRMSRNYLAHASGDAINAVLTAAAIISAASSRG